MGFHSASIDPAMVTNTSDAASKALADFVTVSDAASKADVAALAASDAASKAQVKANAASSAIASRLPVATAQNDMLVAGGTPFPWQKKTIDEARTVIGSALYHGFVNRTSSTLTWTNTSPARTMTITGTYVYWYQGNQITVSTSKAVQITNTTGLWYIYFNSSGVLTASQTFPGYEAAVTVCYVMWNGSAGIVVDERHGYQVNRQWHNWAHNTIGARYQAGIAVTASGVGAAATFSSTSGDMWDEDIDFTLPASSAFTTPNACRIIYQIAASGVNAYTFVTAPSTIPFLWNAGTSRVRYVNAAGPYALADVNANKYINAWVYATPDINQPIYVMVETVATATTGYANAADARLAASPTLSLVGLFPEMRFLYRLVIKGDGTVQAMIAADDYRATTPIPAGGSPATSAGAVTFTPYGNIAGTTVQAAVQELDDEKAPLVSPSLTTPNLGTPSAGNLASCTGYPINIVDDTTPQLGGFLDLNKKYVSITIGLADQEFCGITIEGTGGETLAFGELCYFKTSDSKWWKTNATATATSGTPQLGVCVLAGASTATRMLLLGSIRANSLFDTFTIGAPVYASAATAGKIVSAAPTGVTGFVVRIIGRATTDDEIFVNISPDYIELA